MAEAAQTTAGTETEATDEDKGAAGAETGSKTAAEEAAPAGDDGVGIPRQQSAAQAAETEAEEGART
ncbi:gliding motility protein [Streptomyces sp. NPDC047079]|uniref:gliding motility protein n=1 Tax=Streptomyces sp. NPDC047079 TaxID=3154607 RepID=UPI0033DD47A6